jgi:polyvinyl alcohol dehydrogenase (cytochrome)
VRWQHLRDSRCPDRSCYGGLSAAISATPELVITGSLDGFLEVYDASTGDLLWSHDSWRTYDTVNGVAASGGSFDAHGPMIADDQVMVASGYGSFGQKGGNAFLVFAIEPEVQP